MLPRERDECTGFNPTMVRLLRVSVTNAIWLGGSFNPTMVRLLQITDFSHASTHASFQSHNGAIAAGSVRVDHCYDDDGFNPTMVRLLRQTRSLEPPVQLSFQSHNGAIAAASRREGANFRGSGFNPTMVRLLQGNWRSYPSC